MKIYEKDFEEEAMKLYREIEIKKAAGQLRIPQSTLAGWRSLKPKYIKFDVEVVSRTVSKLQLIKKIKE